MLLTIKHKILIALFEKGPLQNSEIAEAVGISEQWCSEKVAILRAEGFIETETIGPRRISRLTKKGVEIAKHLKEINTNRS